MLIYAPTGKHMEVVPYFTLQYGQSGLSATSSITKCVNRSRLQVDMQKNIFFIFRRNTVKNQTEIKINASFKKNPAKNSEKSK